MNYLHDISVSPYIFYPQNHKFIIFTCILLKSTWVLLKFGMAYSYILLKSTWILLKSVINRHGLFLYRRTLICNPLQRYKNRNMTIFVSARRFIKKRISDFLAIHAIKSDKKSPQLRQKSPKIVKNRQKQACRFLAIFTYLTCVS